MQGFWQKYTAAGFIHDKFMLNIVNILKSGDFCDTKVKLSFIYFFYKRGDF